MKIKFADRGHKEFYLSMQGRCKTWDCYHKALFYVLGLLPDCRQKIDSLFDFKDDRIKPGGLRDAWHTSGSLIVVKMAFNLWNGYTGKKDASDYSPDRLFNSGYAPFFYEGIRLRYPDETREERYQIVDGQGSIVQENICSNVLAEGYVRTFTKQFGGEYKIEPMPEIVEYV